MKDEDILKEIKGYFKIEELVGKRTFKRYGERSWRFLDLRMLHALLIVRKNLDKSITANDWVFGGKMQQRGLRTIVQNIVLNMVRRKRLYLSAHLFGKAVDFDVKGMTALEVRSWIIKNKHLFPFKIRLEKGVTWVHMDVIFEEKNSKVYLFNA